MAGADTSWLHSATAVGAMSLTVFLTGGSSHGPLNRSMGCPRRQERGYTWRPLSTSLKFPTCQPQEPVASLGMPLSSSEELGLGRSGSHLQVSAEERCHPALRAPTVTVWPRDREVSRVGGSQLLTRPYVPHASQSPHSQPRSCGCLSPSSHFRQPPLRMGQCENRKTAGSTSDT